MGRVAVPAAPMPTGTPTAGQVVYVSAYSGGAVTLSYLSLGTAATLNAGAASGGAAGEVPTLGTGGSLTLAGAITATSATISGIATVNQLRTATGGTVETAGSALGVCTSASSGKGVYFGGNGWSKSTAGDQVSVLGTMSHTTGVVNGLLVQPTNSSTGTTYGVVGQVKGSTGTRIPIAARNDAGADVFTVLDTGLATATGLRLATSSPPASATATGAAGTITWDANYVYVCTATNAWKRTALSTW